MKQRARRYFTQTEMEEVWGRWDSEHGWRHDQTLKHSYVNAGVGFDYLISERYSVGANYYRSISSDNIYELDAAFTIAFTRNY